MEIYSIKELGNSQRSGSELVFAEKDGKSMSDIGFVGLSPKALELIGLHFVALILMRIISPYKRREWWVNHSRQRTHLSSLAKILRWSNLHIQFGVEIAPIRPRPPSEQFDHVDSSLISYLICWSSVRMHTHQTHIHTNLYHKYWTALNGINNFCQWSMVHQPPISHDIFSEKLNNVNKRDTILYTKRCMNYVLFYDCVSARRSYASRYKIYWDKTKKTKVKVVRKTSAHCIQTDCIDYVFWCDKFKLGRLPHLAWFRRNICVSSVYTVII